MKILLPAYTRDYASKKSLLADFDAGKDFILRDMLFERDMYINKPQIAKGEQVKFRYFKLRKTFIHTVD